MFFETITALALQLGSAGLDEPIYGGVIIFGITGVIVLYLAFIHEEMDANIQMKVLGILLVALALLSAFWPVRPWPR